VLWNITGSLAQSPETGIQQVYQQFSKAYEELDPTMIAPLYAEETYYLTPDPEEGIRKGKDEVLKSFTGTFKQAEKRGTELKMTFKIIKRDQSGSIAYDVGYYKFEAFPEEGQPFEAVGKFVTVLQKNNQGDWQFVVDAFSDAPINVFEESK
jgi:ketosteroid isomerase-like protein